MDVDRTQLDAEWQRAFDYVESSVGGRSVGAERQPRWRPAWFLEREGGERASIYLRGARGERPGSAPPSADVEAAVLGERLARGQPRDVCTMDMGHGTSLSAHLDWIGWIVERLGRF